MKLPKVIWIHDNAWRVKMVKKPVADERNSRHQTVGLCSPEDCTISIKSRQTEYEKISTLVHEILHAIEYEYEIDVPHDLIYKLEGPITDILIDNFL